MDPTPDLFRRAPTNVDRILRGASPATSGCSANQVRSGNQSQNRKGARPPKYRDAAGPRRRGDRMSGGSRRRNHGITVLSSRPCAGPICGRPPWHKSFVSFDRIACAHMSGLLVRLVRPLAKIGFPRQRVPINHATFVRPMVPRFARTSDRSDPTIYSALAAPVRPVG